MAFAQFEMKLVISGILSGFELALADSRSVRPVRRGLTSGPSPFRMVVKERRPNSRSAKTAAETSEFRDKQSEAEAEETNPFGNEDQEPRAERRADQPPAGTQRACRISSWR
jgi:hypothetical protein